MLVELTLFVCLVCLLYKLLWNKSKIDGIPGPRQVPWFGNALQVDDNKLHMNFMTWYKQYGPMVRFKLLFDEFVLVSDPDDIHEVIVKRGQDFAGRISSYRSEFMSSGFKDIVSTDWSPEVKWRRKVMHAYIKQYGSGMDKIEKITDDMASELVRNMCSVGEKEAVDMNYTFYSVTMDILAVMLLGDVLEDKETKDMMYTIIPLVNESFKQNLSGILIDRLPWTRYLGNPAFKRMVTIQQKRQKLVSSLIDIQRKNESDGFIKQLLEIHSEEVKHDVLEQQIYLFILAGTLTTSTTLTSLANTLVHHPQVQQKLQEEVHRAVGYGRSVTMKDKQEMPYHMATIYEISRLASVAFFMDRKALKDTRLGKYDFPKGVVAIINMFALHHDEKLWDEPFSFRPERFIDQDGKLVPADHPNRRHLVPFSAGPRVCVGEVLAMSRIFLILAKMMQNFTLLPATTMENQPSFDPRDFKATGFIIEVEVKVQPINRDN